MNYLNKRLGLAVILVLGLLGASVASASTVVMNFDQLNANGEYVANYYNGGCGSSYGGNTVTCGGPDYGVVWNGAVAGYAPNGLYGNTSNSPSAPGVMGIMDSSNAYMDVAAGFDTGFSFYYSAPYFGGSVSVWSGLDGTGTLLATLNLPLTAANCGQTGFSCWDPVGVTFAGIARSVDFSGTANYIVFDDVTLGAGTPDASVPEPAALGLLAMGLLLIGVFVGLRRRFN